MQVQDTTIKAHTRGRGTAHCICEHCGEPFMAKPYRVKVGQARWCSGHCVVMAQRSEYERTLPDTAEIYAYLAAMIDGEGSISIIRSKDRGKGFFRYRLGLYVTNISRPLMDWFVTHFSGNVFNSIRPSGKNVMTWKAKDVSVELILRRCLPFMIVKREQAMLALTFRPDASLFTKAATAPAELARRDALWMQMSKLNAAGGKVRAGMFYKP